MTPPISPGPAAAATPSIGVEAEAGFLHRLRDDGVQHLHMGAGGDLRHHAAESRVLFDLRQHHIGEDAPAAVLGAFDHRGRGLVAGGFDAEDDHGFLMRHPGRAAGPNPEKTVL